MSLTCHDRTPAPRLAARTQVAAPPGLSKFDLTGAVRTDACVLLTGRDDAVRALAYRIHRLSEWREGPFTIVDCGAPAELVERTLAEAFGERSAPVSQNRRGGTLLLHDVAQLEASAQRGLADRLARMRGAHAPDRGRRVMATTPEPLLPRVLDGTFDDHLFYRLNVIHLVLPGEKRPEKARNTLASGNRYLASRGIAHDAGRSVPRLSLRG